MKCDMCGKGGVTLPYVTTPVTWLHDECWEKWRVSGFPPLKQRSQSRPVDSSVEAHCRLAFADWDNFSEPDKRYWRAKYQPHVCVRVNEAA